MNNICDIIKRKDEEIGLLKKSLEENKLIDKHQLQLIQSTSIKELVHDMNVLHETNSKINCKIYDSM